MSLKTGKLHSCVSGQKQTLNDDSACNIVIMARLYDRWSNQSQVMIMKVDTSELRQCC